MPSSWVPDCGDIVWLEFDLQAGREQAREIALWRRMDEALEIAADANSLTLDGVHAKAHVLQTALPGMVDDCHLMSHHPEMRLVFSLAADVLRMLA